MKSALGRVGLAGFLGGVVLILWGTVAHMLPLGAAGIRILPPADEVSVRNVLRGAMKERALYFVPALDPSRKMSSEEERAWRADYVAGPVGIVAFNPRPADRVSADAFFATVFATELAGDVLAALLAAMLIRFVPDRLGFFRRALLVGSLGLIMTLDVDVSYWNWYGFPRSYTLVQLLDHGVGWCLAGLVLARLCRGSVPALP